MSASDNLSVKLFRGLKVHPKDVDDRRLGEHWTSDPEVAKDFATHGTFPGEPGDGHGTVVEATVSKDNIIKPHTKEWEERGGGDLDSGLGIFGPESSEKEHTLRFGSRVNIDRLTHFHKGTKVADLEPENESGLT